ncbi:hypothetical protein [Curtobacterium sp. MCJR17_043]|uniref:hypothetical protein n=1 Tax=Curtobacterium sp. MCJR17_043 TaxID=2175660 RepID=UPI0024DF690E|nr:hypothetical protein [Curtobacterium sp. MCJR17_043]WIB36378.1 hypothetical protein DEJ15_04260 [Curtobacterium sp. MCJR17_043]
MNLRALQPSDAGVDFGSGASWVAGALPSAKPVPEPTTVKNREHLDLGGEDAAAEIRSSRSALSESPGWTTTADSERNEVCVLREAVSGDGSCRPARRRQAQPAARFNGCSLNYFERSLIWVEKRQATLIEKRSE